MKQFILDAVPDRSGRVRLEGGDYRYLVRVRRLAPGEYFPARLPGGDEAAVRIVSIDNHALVGEVFPSECTRQPSALPPIILLQALPKGEKMDIIVRQAAEGGITEIVPFASEFSVAKIKGNQRLPRWQRIIREARQQSGSAEATEIQMPLAMDGLFTHWERLKTRWPGVVGLLFHHLPLAHESLHRYLGTYPEAVAVAVGPEGGFSPAEAERFLAVGFKPFTIGDSVLRTETAALYAQAAVRILLAERDSWETK